MAVKAGWVLTCAILSLVPNLMLCAVREVMTDEIRPSSVEADKVITTFSAASSKDHCSDLDTSTRCDVSGATDGTADVVLIFEETHCIKSVVSFASNSIEPADAQATWSVCHIAFEGCIVCTGSPTTQCNQLTIFVTNVGGDDTKPVQDDCINGNKVTIERSGSEAVILFRDIAVIEKPEPVVREVMPDEIRPSSVEADEIITTYRPGSAEEHCSDLVTNNACDVTKGADGTAYVALIFAKTHCIKSVVSFKSSLEPADAKATWTCTKDGCTDCTGSGAQGQPDRDADQCDTGVTISVTNVGGDDSKPVQEDCVYGNKVSVEKPGEETVIYFYDIAVTEKPVPEPEPEDEDEDEDDDNKGTAVMTTPALLIATSIWGLARPF